MTTLSFDIPVNFALGTVYEVATGDFDGDGNLDIVAAGYGYDNSNYSYDGKISILLGDGDGGFDLVNELFVESYSSIGTVLVGDFNGDGNTDIITNGGFRNPAKLLLGDGTGHFSSDNSNIEALNYSSIAGDINGDGFDDIISNASYSYSNGDVTVTLANATGGFDSPIQFQTGIYSRDILSGDFNGDGNLDLATSNNNYYNGTDATVSILLGDGTGNFSAPTDFSTSGYAAQTLTSADFNGDGALDLATFDYYNNGSISILLGDGTGKFGAATVFEAQSQGSLDTGDLNQDGNIDLVLSSSNYNGEISVFLGDGAGGFRLEKIETGRYNGDFALGDFNGDGASDIVTANGYNNGASVVISVLGQNLIGTKGKDILVGGNGPDTLEGLGGNDILEGDRGSDQISGGLGKDDITGGDGDDTISGGSGSDIITGGNDDDQITGDKGNDNLAGNNGNDTLNGGAGKDRLRGDLGADRLLGGANDDTLFGGDGKDTLIGQANNDILFGGAGNDHLTGSGGHDSLFGEAGADTLRGGAGLDTLEGGNGNDDLAGGGANDSLVGGSGNDVLQGNAGADTLRGGTGDDTLSGGKGNDVLDGEGGIDTVDFSQFKQAITLLPQGVINAGSDGLEQIQNIEVVIGAQGKANAIDGTVADGPTTLDVNLGLNQLIVNHIADLDRVEFTVENFMNVTGTSNQDQITGNSLDNELFGGQENDVFGASAGNDFVDGGEGSDRIDYTDLATAVTLSPTGILEKGAQGVDTLRGIEVVTGAPGQANTIDGNPNLDSPIRVDIDLADNTFTVLDSPSGGPVFFEVENFVNATGSQNDDSLAGDNRSNLLIGGAGNDWLYGRGGRDILIGVDSTSPTAGQNQLDTLTGGTGADTYVLGDANTVFYAFSGDDDFALIHGFQSGRDLIQLSGTLTDYVFSGIDSNTAIYQDGNRNGIVDANDELIAQFSITGFVTSDLTFT